MNTNIQVETKEPFQVAGTTVYQLEFDSWRQGVAQQRNRVYANVQGYRDTPKEELEATALLFAAAPELLAFAEWFIDNRDGAGRVMALAAIAKAQGESL